MNGEPIPEAVANKPEVDAISVLYYDAFKALRTERRFPGGPIPWMSATIYADRMRFDGEQRQILHQVVADVDNWLLGFLNKDSEKPPE